MNANENHPSVICLGLSVYDLTWYVPTLPSGPGKSRASAHHQSGGGNAANAAVTVAKLGGSAQLWARSGADVIGRQMLAELERLGVNVAGVRLYEGLRASVSAVFVDAQGERMIVNYKDASLPDACDWLPWQTVATADVVLADPRWPSAAKLLFAEAERTGTPRVLDGESSEPEVFDALLPLTSHAVFSETGLRRYAPADAPLHDQLAFAKQRGCRMAAVTLGAKGIIWLDDDNQMHHQPAFQVEVVDTTGAGDVFHGAFAYALGSGRNEKEAFRLAAAVAAMKCTQPGGRDGIPTLQAAHDFLAGSPPERSE